MLVSIRRVGSSPVSRTTLPLWKALHHARVVELADSLDSGSSVLYGRAGSSPASRTTSEQAAYRLLRLFQKSERAHCAAPPFQIEPASLGFDLVLGAISKENRFYPLIAGKTLRAARL